MKGKMRRKRKPKDKRKRKKEEEEANTRNKLTALYKLLELFSVSIYNKGYNSNKDKQVHN